MAERVYAQRSEGTEVMTPRPGAGCHVRPGGHIRTERAQRLPGLRTAAQIRAPLSSRLIGLFAGAKHALRARTRPAYLVNPTVGTKHIDL